MKYDNIEDDHHVYIDIPEHVIEADHTRSNKHRECKEWTSNGTFHPLQENCFMLISMMISCLNSPEDLFWIFVSWTVFLHVSIIKIVWSRSNHQKSYLLFILMSYSLAMYHVLIMGYLCLEEHHPSSPLQMLASFWLFILWISITLAYIICWGWQTFKWKAV